MAFLSERHECLKQLGVKLGWELEEDLAASVECDTVTGSQLELEGRTIPAFEGSLLKSMEG